MSLVAVQFSRLLCASMQLLNEIKAATGPLCCMVEFVFNRFVDLAKDACDKAATDLQHMLEYDAATSASMRTCMIQGLLLDPPMHGLAHACAAAAHCDGACTSESVAAIVAGVQPGADTTQVRWLQDLTVTVCTRSMPSATHPCACRVALLRRLLHGPDWAASMQLLRGACVPLASQPPGTPGRRFVVAVRLQANETSQCCAAPRCTLESSNTEITEKSLVIRTYAAIDLLPYESGGLDVRFGVVRASADALAALAAAASKWVNEADADGVCLCTPGRGTDWRMWVQETLSAASLYKEGCGSVPLYWLRRVAEELGYSEFGETWGEPIWVCVFGHELPDSEEEQT